MERAVREWRNRVVAEYTSAALTAQVVQWMIQAALPDPLLRTGLRIVGDELDHANLCEEVVLDLDPAAQALALDISRLAVPPSPDGLLASLVDQVVRAFCLGETFAVPLFSEMRAHATHPLARAALDRILRDEAVHRAFGWQALDALLELDRPGVVARVEAGLSQWVGWFFQAYGRHDQGPALSDAERGLGMLELPDYARIYRSTLQEEIGPRFARRGITVPAGVAGPARASGDAR